MRRDLKLDQAEVDDIELRLLETIRTIKAASSPASAKTA